VWMARTYEHADLVQLPKVNANGALALGKEMLTRADAAKPLPERIAKSVKKLRTSYEALRTAAQGRHLDPVTPDSEAARLADRDIDAAWSGTYDWLRGWAKLPGEENAQKAASARQLIAELFADGLEFTQIAFKLEWAESQTRLDYIHDKGLEAKFTALGGGDFLKTIRAKHDAYGKALGLTKAKVAAPSAPSLREPLEAFLAALRSYVVRVSDHIDEDAPETAELAQQLLAPLSEWRTPAGSAPSSGDEPAAPSPPADKPKPGEE
jgi:hypothetical protein